MKQARAEWVWLRVWAGEFASSAASITKKAARVEKSMVRNECGPDADRRVWNGSGRVKGGCQVGSSYGAGTSGAAASATSSTASGSAKASLGTANSRIAASTAPPPQMIHTRW